MFSITIRRIALFAVFSVPIAFANAVRADVVSVADHSLADWGISISSSDVLKVPSGVAANPNFYNQINNYSDSYSTNLANVKNTNLSPTATFNGFKFWYNYEDDTDNTLGPHTGGQDYDGEFLGVGVSGAYLAISIVTGQRPDNGSTYYAPGDLRIVTSLGTFGVELTGKTYNLDNSGYTQGSSTAPFAAGTVVKTTSSSNWKTPPSTLPPATPVQLVGGTSVGSLNSSEFYSAGDSQKYTNYYGTLKNSKHTIYELLIPLSYFGVAEITSVHWAPSCGNDLLDVNTNINHMPEPTSLALAGFAGIGFALRALRRRRSLKSDQAA